MPKTIRISILVVAVLLAAPGVASAGTQHMRFYIARTGNMTSRQIHAAEQAITIQVNEQVRKHWRVAPISFGPGGIPIYVDSSRQIANDCGPGIDGCHGPGADGKPAIWIADNWYDTETRTLSHEIIETAVDPNGQATVASYVAEPCDEVDANSYQQDGVMLSDFVYPRWFMHGSSGPWDFMGTVRHALRLGGYGYDDPLG
jgi:hypothetical protein